MGAKQLRKWVTGSLGVVVGVMLTACVQNTTTSSRPSETSTKPEEVPHEQALEEETLKEAELARDRLAEIREGDKPYTVDPSYFNELNALTEMPGNIVTVFVYDNGDTESVSATERIDGNTLFEVNGCSRISPVITQFSDKQIILFSVKKAHAKEFFYSLREDCRVYHDAIFYLDNNVTCSSDSGCRAEFD